jgi:hypothetical protein
MDWLLIMAAICLAEFLVAFGIGYATQRFFSTIVFVTLVNIAVCAPFLFYAVVFGGPAFVSSLFGAGFGSSLASSRKGRNMPDEKAL